MGIFGIALTPSHAKTLADGGWTKQKIKDYIIENARAPTDLLKKFGPGVRGSIFRDISQYEGDFFPIFQTDSHSNKFIRIKWKQETSKAYKIQDTLGKRNYKRGKYKTQKIAANITHKNSGFGKVKRKESKTPKNNTDRQNCQPVITMAVIIIKRQQSKSNNSCNFHSTYNGITH